MGSGGNVLNVKIMIFAVSAIIVTSIILGIDFTE